MPSNEQRREAAKRKLERQLVRRAERARRRRTIGVIVTVAAVIVVVGGIYLIATAGHGSSTAAAATSTSATPTTTTAAAKPGVATTGPCKYTTTPSSPAPTGKDVGVPADPSATPKTGTVAVDLKTTQGDIPLTLDRADAPCTVQSFLHLVTSKFYDNTPCHRLTADPGLYVLQCGDPTGTGEGGPGYTIPDEFNSAKTLKAAPASADQSGSAAAVIYPAGTIAMANTGQANTGGSQFFLVYKDSYLPPQYTVFGTFDPTGQTTLNKIAAGGITPGENGADDGAPKLKVTITNAVEN